MECFLGRPCALTEIFVVYDQAQQYPKVIDGKVDESMGWANHPRSGMTNAAIVTTHLERAPDDDLRFGTLFLP